MDYAKDVLKTYSHRPELQTVAVGLGIGLLRLGAGQYLIQKIPFLKKLQGQPIQLQWKNALFPMISLIAPFAEEHWFRKSITKDSSYSDIVINAVMFGALHGLIPGNTEQRIGRIFSSSVGGLFYGAAQKATGDCWAPALAHFMWNAVGVYNGYKLR